MPDQLAEGEGEILKKCHGEASNTGIDTACSSNSSSGAIQSKPLQINAEILGLS
jgi:hypothetical protein